jgi:hypothetical protein
MERRKQPRDSKQDTVQHDASCCSGVSHIPMHYDNDIGMSERALYGGAKRLYVCTRFILLFAFNEIRRLLE